MGRRVLLLCIFGVLGLATACSGDGGSAEPSRSDRPTPSAEKKFAESKFVPTADCRGRTVGYVRGPANPSPNTGGSADEVYKNPDGSGGIVGYNVDFGFVDKATFEAPGFNLDAARAACFKESAKTK